MVVAQRLPVQRQHRAAGRFQYALRRGGIPFRGGAETRIHVHATFGDATEFQRRAQPLRFDLAHAPHRRRRALIQVRATGSDAQGRRCRLAAQDRHVLVAIAHEGADAANAVMQFFQRRRIDHAEHGFAVFDQGNVDGEFAVLLDELARAVERIDQPVACPGATLFPGDAGRFFRQHRQLRRQPTQAVDDEMVRGEIGGGQRRAIVLVLDGEVPRIDFHDRDAGRDGDIDHGTMVDTHRRIARTSRTTSRPANDRPSEQSSRNTSSCSASSFQGTTSSSSGSSPGRRSG